MSMLIYIHPRSRIHVMVSRSSYATLYLSEWPWHTTPGPIISYTNLLLSICCEYSKEPSLCDCSLEHPEHMHTPLSYQKTTPRTITIFLLKAIPPPLINRHISPCRSYIPSGHAALLMLKDGPFKWEKVSRLLLNLQGCTPLALREAHYISPPPSTQGMQPLS